MTDEGEPNTPTWAAVCAHKDEILQLRAQGATLAQCAAYLGVSREAFRVAVRDHAEFRKQMNAALIPLCANVRGKLYDLAIGKSETRERARVIRHGEVVGETARIIQHPPSIGAALALLRRYESGDGWDGRKLPHAETLDGRDEFLFDVVRESTTSASESEALRVSEWWRVFSSEFGVTESRTPSEPDDKYLLTDDYASPDE